MKKSILFLFLAVFLILSSCSSDSRDEAEPIWYYLTKRETIKNGNVFKTFDYKGTCRSNTRLNIESDDTIKYINSIPISGTDCKEVSSFAKYNSINQTIDFGSSVIENYKIEGNRFIIYHEYQNGDGNQYEDIEYYEAR